jgi:hypothetical protein
MSGLIAVLMLSALPCEPTADDVGRAGAIFARAAGWTGPRA